MMDNYEDKIKWFESRISSQTKKTLQIRVFLAPIMIGCIVSVFCLIPLFFAYKMIPIWVLLLVIIVPLAIFICLYLAYLKGIRGSPSRVGYCKKGIYYVTGKDRRKSIILWKDVISISSLSLHEGREYEVCFHDVIGRKKSFCISSVIGRELEQYFRKILKEREKNLLEKVKK